MSQTAQESLQELDKARRPSTPEERHAAAMKDPAQAAMLVVAEIIKSPQGLEWAQLFLSMLRWSAYSFAEFPDSPQQAKEWLDAGRAFMELKNKGK